MSAVLPKAEVKSRYWRLHRWALQVDDSMFCTQPQIGHVHFSPRFVVVEAHGEYYGGALNFEPHEGSSQLRLGRLRLVVFADLVAFDFFFVLGYWFEESLRRGCRRLGGVLGFAAFAAHGDVLAALRAILTVIVTSTPGCNSTGKLLPLSLLPTLSASP
jgi:hypothetical protein